MSKLSATNQDRLTLSGEQKSKIPVYNKSLINYVEAHCFSPSPVLAKVRDEASHDELGYMITGQDQAAFLNLLVKLTQATRILEIGCYLGHSAIALASALPETGELICLDHNPTWSAKALAFIAEAGLSDKVDLRIGEALDLLKVLESESNKPFDLVFIDADKKNAYNYFERVIPLVKPGGVIIVDNVLWRGGIIDDGDQSDRAVALRKLNENVMSRPDLEPMILTLSDGMLIARKRIF